jgi:hypothetical protein
MKKLAILAILAVSVALSACKPDEPSVKNAQAAKAREAAQSITFTENAEIDNIKKRLELTANPGLLGYIVLLNESGQPVFYSPIKGKVTSGSKRLTPPDRYQSHSNGAMVMQAASDEGTYGSSGEYIFFWTTAGQFMQWNGKYLYSDKPIRLSVQPLVVAVDQPVAAK